MPILLNCSPRSIALFLSFFATLGCTTLAFANEEVASEDVSLPVQSDVETLEQKPSRSIEGSHDFVAVQIEEGFVFLNGIYVASPYELEIRNGNLLINGMAIPLSQFSVIEEDGRSRKTPRSLMRKLERSLWEGGVLIHLNHDEPVLAGDSDFGYPFTRFLAGRPNPEELIDEMLESLPESSNFRLWEDFLLSLSVPPELRERADSFLRPIEDVEQKNFDQIRSQHQVASLNYPLTLLGMVLSVVAFGHVLQFRPDPNLARNGVILNPAPDAIQMVNRCVAFVIVLSGLDLIWTILAWQSGQMRELNPFASGLIDDPVALVAFKAIATAIAASLLYLLRQYRQAQQVSWWMCLLCTILTFRWLIFNSMFMS
ncbi:MAG: hypothetical protein KDA80_12200 [Planctomycetaceae bacterium]|nr:hypothetical protein [Planctomycetaceae bacterium]